jgi:hypothetical protein
MSKKRNSITINIDEYEFEIVLHNHPFHNFYNLELALEPRHIYILIRKNHALMEYWARFYQKDNRYVSKETLKKVWQNEDLRNLKRIQSSNIMSNEIRKKISDKLTGIKRGKRKEEHIIKSANGLKEYYKTNSVYNKIIFSKEKEDLIFKYYNEKMPISKIAKHFFVSRPVIYRIINKIK